MDDLSPATQRIPVAPRVILFRQESYFNYLFGVENEDYYGAVDLRSVSCHAPWRGREMPEGWRGKGDGERGGGEEGRRRQEGK